MNKMIRKFSEKNITEICIFSLNYIPEPKENKFKDYRLLKRKPESVKELHQYCMRTIIGIYRHKAYRPDFIQSTLDYRLRKRFNSIKFSLKPDKNKGRALPFKHNRILTGLSIFKDINVSKCDSVMIVQKFIAGNVGGYFNE